MQGSAMLGPGVGEHERSGSKIDSREAAAPREPCALRLPMEAACDHQVQHEPEIPFYPNRDTFADSPEFADDFCFNRPNGRLHRAKQKRAGQAHSFEWLAFERSDVCGDIWQFRHAYEIAGWSGGFATVRYYNGTAPHRQSRKGRTVFMNKKFRLVFVLVCLASCAAFGQTEK